VLGGSAGESLPHAAVLKADLMIGRLESDRAVSPREAEIMRLLARGRNVPFICDELFIAKSTVQTHVKHIYTKLGVSNRQELIDYLERSGDGNAVASG
jgi:DNA-binding NarL/FixJ family response regulator